MVHTFTRERLLTIMREAAGEADLILPDDPDVVMQMSFQELGYDSLAVMETTGRIKREHFADLDTDVADGAKSPEELFQIIASAASTSSEGIA